MANLQKLRSDARRAKAPKPPEPQPVKSFEPVAAPVAPDNSIRDAALIEVLSYIAGKETLSREDVKSAVLEGVKEGIKGIKAPVVNVSSRPVPYTFTFDRNRSGQMIGGTLTPVVEE